MSMAKRCRNTRALLCQVAGMSASRWPERAGGRQKDELKADHTGHSNTWKIRRRYKILSRPKKKKKGMII